MSRWVLAPFVALSSSFVPRGWWEGPSAVCCCSDCCRCIEVNLTLKFGWFIPLVVGRQLGNLHGGNSV